MANEFFVLMENGQPVGVARADREAAARRWEKEKSGRALVKVEEQR